MRREHYSIILPSTSENHWTYAIPRQRHGKALTNHRIEVEKMRVKINGAESPRGNNY